MDAGLVARSNESLAHRGRQRGLIDLELWAWHGREWEWSLGLKHACEVKDMGLGQQRIRKPNEVNAPPVAAHFAHKEPNSSEGPAIQCAERGSLPPDRSFPA